MLLAFKLVILTTRCLNSNSRSKQECDYEVWPDNNLQTSVRDFIVPKNRSQVAQFSSRKHFNQASFHQQVCLSRRRWAYSAEVTASPYVA